MNLLSELDNQLSSNHPSSAPANSGAKPDVKPPTTSSRKSEQDVSFNKGAGGGLRISLMPTGLEDGGGNLRRWIVVLIILFLLETVVIGVGYLFLVKKETGLKERRGVLEQQIGQLAEDIKSTEIEAREVAQFNLRVDTANNLLDNHLYWTGIFKHLAEQTKKGVKYLNFAGDFASQTLTMDAIGRSYQEVAEQIVVFKEDPIIENVETTSAAARINERGEIIGVGFSLVLKLTPKIWLENFGK
jgi:Tfp pilus assembly protein PilN